MAKQSLKLPKISMPKIPKGPGKIMIAVEDMKKPKAPSKINMSNALKSFKKA